MNFDPQKFFIGLMDFFSILLPGALLTWLLMGEVGPVVLGDRYATLTDAEAWAAFLFASYVFGHPVFLSGSWLDEFYLTRTCLPEFRQAKAEGFRGPQKICFFAMATDAGGAPIIRRSSDPRPGYFVSTTALKQAGEDARTPQAQLDSNTVPYVVIPSTWQSSGEPGPRLGDFGVAWRRSNGKFAYFIAGDIGSRNQLGEGSIALHQALGNDPFMDRFGVRRARKGIGGRDVVYVIFPHSARAGERIDAASIERATASQLQHFGGVERLQDCSDSLANGSQLPLKARHGESP